MIQQLLPNEWPTNFKIAYEFAYCDDALFVIAFGMLLFKIRTDTFCISAENEHSLKKKFVYISDKIYTIVYVNRLLLLCFS